MPDAVADIGNSRIKLCQCDETGLKLPVRALGDDDQAGWDQVVSEWGWKGGQVWAVAASNPERRDQFVERAAVRGDHVISIESYQQIPIRVNVDQPERVGIDRLLNTVAAAGRVKPGEPAIIVDAGSAVTINLLDQTGAFAGGAIFPGLRLMALALYEHTARLPLVDPEGAIPPGPPGKNTDAAIRLGILHAVAGGIDALVRETASRCSVAPQLILTGGDMTPRLAGLLTTRHTFRSEVRPALTLEGILLTARQLP